MWFTVYTRSFVNYQTSTPGQPWSKSRGFEKFHSPRKKGRSLSLIYSWLRKTLNPWKLEDRADSNQIRFPKGLPDTFTVILPSITRILDNSNLSLTRSKSDSPSGHFLTNFPSKTRTLPATQLWTIIVYQSMRMLCIKISTLESNLWEKLLFLHLWASQRELRQKFKFKSILFFCLLKFEVSWGSELRKHWVTVSSNFCNSWPGWIKYL